MRRAKPGSKDPGFFVCAAEVEFGSIFKFALDFANVILWHWDVATIALVVLWLGVPETLPKYTETDAGCSASDRLPPTSIMRCQYRFTVRARPSGRSVRLPYCQARLLLTPFEIE